MTIHPCAFRILTLLVVGLLPAAPSHAQQLLVHYTFDQPRGDALDTGVPPAANGVFQPLAQRTTDTPGNTSPRALDLSAEGTESFVNSGDVAKVDTLTSFTMTTWLKLEGLNQDQGGSGNVRLLAKQTGGNFDGFSWNLNDPNEGDRDITNFRLGMFIGGELEFSFGQSTEDLGAENWTFLAVTYDGTQDVDNLEFLWGDETTGVALLGDPLSITAGAVASTEGTADFGIGFTDALADTDFAAYGFQDDVRVYDDVLTLGQLEEVRLDNLVTMPLLRAGDANQDRSFDQLDIIQVQISAKYLTGQAATWGEGDWDGAPGGIVGNPPPGDGVFDQLDIISALNAATYLTGPYAANRREEASGDGQTSIVDNAATGDVARDIPAPTQWTSTDTHGATGIFTNHSAQNLGEPSYHDADNNLLKATTGSSFGTLSFGNVAQIGLAEAFLPNDLTIVGPLADGRTLGDVGLIYVPVPEPSSMAILAIGVGIAFACFRPRMYSGNWNSISLP